MKISRLMFKIQDFVCVIDFAEALKRYITYLTYIQEKSFKINSYKKALSNPSNNLKDKTRSAHPSTRAKTSSTILHAHPQNHITHLPHRCVSAQSLSIPPSSHRIFLLDIQPVRAPLLWLQALESLGANLSSNRDYATDVLDTGGNKLRKLEFLLSLAMAERLRPLLLS